MVRWLRSVAKRLLHALTRRLHPRYRQAAQRALADRAAPQSILFLCLGNVCRSPYARAAFLRMSPGSRVDSAGFIGPDRAAAPGAQAVAQERGLDLSTHVSKVVTPELARRFDLIVVMEPRQRVALKRKVGSTSLVIALGDLDPSNPGRRVIRDPWGEDIGVFRTSFDRIDRCLAELLPFVEAPASGMGE